MAASSSAARASYASGGFGVNGCRAVVVMPGLIDEMGHARSCKGFGVRTAPPCDGCGLGAGNDIRPHARPAPAIQAIRHREACHYHRWLRDGDRRQGLRVSETASDRHCRSDVERRSTSQPNGSPSTSELPGYRRAVGFVPPRDTQHRRLLPR